MSAKREDTAVLDLEQVKINLTALSAVKSLYLSKIVSIFFQVGSSGLQFTTSTGVTPSSTTHTFSGNVPDSALDDDDKNNLIQEDDDGGPDDSSAQAAAAAKPTNYNFMTLAFYRQVILPP